MKGQDDKGASCVQGAIRPDPSNCPLSDRIGATARAESRGGDQHLTSACCIPSSVVGILGSLFNVSIKLLHEVGMVSSILQVGKLKRLIILPKVTQPSKWQNWDPT